MAITNALITGKVVIPGTTIGVRAKITATPLTRDGALRWPLDDTLSWGPASAETGNDGVIPAPGLAIPLGATVTDGVVLWRFVAKPIDRKDLKSWHIGTFEVTAAASLADLASIEVVAYTPAVVATFTELIADANAAATAAQLAETNAETAQAGAEAARDGAVAIVGPVDGTVEALVLNTGGVGPLTSAALSTTYASYPVLGGEAGVTAKQYPYGDVRRYGADPTGVADSLTAFTNAIAAGPFVLVPKGTFRLTAALTIASGSGAMGFKGEDPALTTLDFVNDTDGIILSKVSALVDGLTVTGSSLTSSGVKCLSSNPKVRGNIISSFGIGVDLAQAVNIVNGTIERNTVMYNRLYGIKTVSTGAAQKNGIRVSRNYVVKNGNDADTLTSNATIGSGDGILTDGGFSLTYDGNISEYNTGVGHRIVSSSYSVRGCLVSNAYFERNKYANLHITEGAFEIRDLDIPAPFYSEAGLTPVANALAEREMYLYPSNLALNGVRLPQSRVGKYGFSERNITVRRPNFLNAFPLNFADDLSTRYASQIITDTGRGHKVMQITQAAPNVVLYDELAYVDPNFDYLLIYDVIRASATATPTLTAIIYDAATEASLGNCNTATPSSWVTVKKRFTFPVNTRMIRLNLAISAGPSDMDVRIDNLRLIPLTPSFDRATPYLLAEVTGIDAKTVADTTLYTVPTGRSLIVTAVQLDSTAAATVSVAPAIGIGINAASDDIYPSATLTGFVSATKRWSFPSPGLTVQIPAGSVVKLGVDTGSTATTHTVTARLFGLLL